MNLFSCNLLQLCKPQRKKALIMCWVLTLGYLIVLVWLILCSHASSCLFPHSLQIGLLFLSSPTTPSIGEKRAGRTPETWWGSTNFWFFIHFYVWFWHIRNTKADNNLKATVPYILFRYKMHYLSFKMAIWDKPFYKCNSWNTSHPVWQQFPTSREIMENKWMNRCIMFFIID